MEKTLKTTGYGLLIMTILIMLVLTFQGIAALAETPERKLVETIKENQDIISKTRDEHIRFMEAKDANVKAVEELRKACFAFDWGTLEIKPIPDCGSGYWLWKEDALGYAEYKNDILKKWQDELRKRGITDKEKLKVYVAQSLQENCSLSPTTIGDHGCSLGLPQRNFCSHAGITAKEALKKWPEWKTVDFQLQWFADSTKAKLDKYGAIKWAIVAHNCPACASRKQDNGYWGDVKKREKAIEWVY